MMVRCTECGALVPPEVAVDLDGVIARFCSLRCSEAGAGRVPARPAVVLPEPPKRILVAVDGSAPSLRATGLAVCLAQLSKGHVTLLHAIDPLWLLLFPVKAAAAGAPEGVSSEEMERNLRSEAAVQLAPCRRVCERGGVPVTERILVETALKAVTEAAEEADLVVMGSRGLGAISGAVLGSLSHRVLGETRKPVLVVH